MNKKITASIVEPTAYNICLKWFHNFFHNGSYKLDLVIFIFTALPIFPDLLLRVLRQHQKPAGSNYSIHRFPLDFHCGLFGFESAVSKDFLLHSRFYHELLLHDLRLDGMIFREQKIKYIHQLLPGFVGE